MVLSPLASKWPEAHDTRAPALGIILLVRGAAPIPSDPTVL